LTDVFEDGLFPSTVVAGGGGARLAVPGGPVFAARVTLDWRTGRTRYQVAGPRIAGSFVLYPDAPRVGEIDPAAYLLPCIDFGVAGEHRNPDRFVDRPQVNGITLYGSHTVCKWEDSVSPWREPWCYLRRDGYQDMRPIPEATRLRTAQICHALIMAWLAMPEWPVLARTHLAHRASERIADITRTIQELYRRTMDLMVEIGRHEQAAGAWTLLSAMPTVMTPEAAAHRGQEDPGDPVPPNVLLLEEHDAQ
jgi:hypothetical protein